MNANAFDRVKYIWFPLISNFDVLIKRSENAAPTESASIASYHGTLASGRANIKKPVAMKKGGSIIFLIVAGFFEAFNLMTIIAIAIIAPTIVLKISIISSLTYTVTPYPFHCMWKRRKIQAYEKRTGAYLPCSPLTILLRKFFFTLICSY